MEKEVESIRIFRTNIAKVKEIQALKVDITKLQTIANYAKARGVTPAWVYKLGNEEKITIIKIDGVKFVKLD